jgi:hypothetical protein
LCVRVDYLVLVSSYTKTTAETQRTQRERREFLRSHKGIEKQREE